MKLTGPWVVRKLVETCAKLGSAGKLRNFVPGAGSPPAVRLGQPSSRHTLAPIISVAGGAPVAKPVWLTVAEPRFGLGSIF